MQVNFSKVFFQFLLGWGGLCQYQFDSPSEVKIPQSESKWSQDSSVRFQEKFLVREKAQHWGGFKHQWLYDSVVWMGGPVAHVAT